MILEERRGPVTVLTIDRPARRNAVDLATCVELTGAIERAAGDGTRVIVLTGAGGHFCAGADLTHVAGEGGHGDDFRPALRRLLDTIGLTPLPVIAAVEGAALGAGTQLAVAADLRVAVPTARFGIPAAKLGLMVDHWTVQRLALLAGHGPARAMLLAAEEVDGDSAHRLGLVQRLGGLDTALEWAERIARLAPLTIAGHKLALNRLEPELADGDVDAAIRRAWASADAVEGPAAFAERRTPDFKGE